MELLSLYFGRKTSVVDGKEVLPRFWIGLSPPVLPSTADIDNAVQEMKTKYTIAKLDRPDDKTADPKKIEHFHVTFCAMIKDQKQGFDDIVAHIKEQKFNADDLQPDIDETTGQHKYTLLHKGGTSKTVFLIFHYKESERLQKARREMAIKYCDMTKYTVHAAHVTAAYGTLSSS